MSSHSPGPACKHYGDIEPSKRSNGWQPGTGGQIRVWCSLRARAHKIGVPRIRFHDLRHSCATLLYAQGVDLQTIKDLLGHSSIGVTSAIYVDVLREVQREAVDRLGHLFGSGDDTDT